MRPPDRDTGGGLAHAATALLDGRARVVGWSREARLLLGYPADAVLGQPVVGLLARPGGAAMHAGAGRAALRHRSGTPVEVAFRIVPLEQGPHADGGVRYLALAVEADLLTEWEQDVAFARAFFDQDHIGLAICDTDLTILRSNVTAAGFGGLDLKPGDHLHDVLAIEDAEQIEERIRGVVESGGPLIRLDRWMRTVDARENRRYLSFSAFRLDGPDGMPIGVAPIIVDTTKMQHLIELHNAATATIGQSLDVNRTARDLALLLVPGFADRVAVDVAQEVLFGGEPPLPIDCGQGALRRVAAESATWGWPRDQPSAGATLPSPHEPGRERGQVTIGAADGTMVAALDARELSLGRVTLWRSPGAEPFDADDAALVQQIASRAALALDNARRYTREHRAAVALQRRLLPRNTFESSAVRAAGTYLPTRGAPGVGGDWFDVIPLSSLRVALVVGDVVGHGLHAAATMARLRTAVQTLADTDLGPDELLTRLDDVVHRLSPEQGTYAKGASDEVIGATCLYAVYDPVTHLCVMASAGHPPPALVRPDGTAEFVDVPPGPPLGVGGVPFEQVEIELEPESLLALYTDGLLDGHHDIERGMRELRERLAAGYRPDRPLEEIGREVLVDHLHAPRTDDVALLLTRVLSVSDDATASWRLTADPSEVGFAREVVAQKLAAWHLDDSVFVAELVVSELVTNAIRYGGGPIGLRLIRDNRLICEVSDGSNTQPRMRRALLTDEGGRGLYLVAQLVERWGSRYARLGKTIWTELRLGGPG